MNNLVNYCSSAMVSARKSLESLFNEGALDLARSVYSVGIEAIRSSTLNFRVLSREMREPSEQIFIVGVAGRDFLSPSPIQNNNTASEEFDYLLESAKAQESIEHCTLDEPPIYPNEGNQAIERAKTPELDLCEEVAGSRGFPAQRPVPDCFDAGFFSITNAQNEPAIENEAFDLVVRDLQEELRDSQRASSSFVKKSHSLTSLFDINKLVDRGEMPQRYSAESQTNSPNCSKASPKVHFSPSVNVWLVADNKEFYEASAIAPDEKIEQFLDESMSDTSELQCPVSLPERLWLQQEEIEITHDLFKEELRKHEKFAKKIQERGYSTSPDLTPLSRGEIVAEKQKTVQAYRKWLALLEKAYCAGIKIFLGRHLEPYNVQLINRLKKLDIPLFLSRPKKAIEEIYSDSFVNQNRSYSSVIFLANAILAKGITFSKLQQPIDTAYEEFKGTVKGSYKRGVDYYLNYGTDKEKKLSQNLQYLDPVKFVVGAERHAVKKALCNSDNRFQLINLR
ncbi:MAG: hypothetical protein KGI80_01215 [Verrucomicrobiota bacterium]|nr:hypothetical protein [Verrucomicrobiota bacterium]